jgi:hypothetical protein
LAHATHAADLIAAVTARFGGINAVAWLEAAGAWKLFQHMLPE